MFVNVVVYTIKVYKLFISPQLVWLTGSHGCKFQPTCAEVTIRGIQQRGILQGLGVGFRQLMKCY